MPIDIAEFVSDYVAIAREQGVRKVTAKEVAQMLAERMCDTPEDLGFEPGHQITDDEFDTIWRNQVAQVAYYL